VDGGFAVLGQGGAELPGQVVGEVEGADQAGGAELLCFDAALEGFDA